MHVSLAAVQVAYRVIRGTAMPGDLTFQKAANDIATDLGYVAACRLMRQCARALEDHYDYKDAAAAVSAMRKSGH